MHASEEGNGCEGGDGAQEWGEEEETESVKEDGDLGATKAGGVAMLACEDDG